MPQLKVVGAGAGSGKTQHLSQTIAERVANGLDPALVVATTFTRKAAAELKGRIQASLLEAPGLAPSERVKKAERLELAVMGTVHSVGHQLLNRYALHLGLSPNLKVLEQEASGRCLQDLMARIPLEPWEELVALGRRFSIEDIQTLVLRMLNAKRSNRITDAAFGQQMSESADRVCRLLHPDGASDHGTEWQRFYDLAATALSDLEGKNDSTDVTAKAKNDLRRMVHGQRKAWEEFLAAIKLSAGKRSGADACLAGLRGAAASLRREPELHRDIREYLERLTTRTIVLEQDYQAYKTERGLVDFTDLELLFLGLLEDSRLSDSLRADLALVVIDEFQDTNPLQLAIFSLLKELAGESRWVGDPKQAIFGFRGTDPDLVRQIWNSVPETDRQYLVDNYRSQKGLVEFVGKVFRPVFGPEAVQNPKRPPMPRGIERWILKGKNKEQDHVALACGIAQLRTEGIPLQDIAILARTNSEVTAIGEALRQMGIPALVELPGLFSTREGTLTLAGLRVVADRRDSLAAATIMHILSDPAKDTPDWLHDRLNALRLVETEKAACQTGDAAAAPIGNPWDDDARLKPLEDIDHRTLPPSVVVQLVFEKLRVASNLPIWGDAARRSSHIDAMVRLACGYEEESWELGTAATLTGLIAHFEELMERGEDTRLLPYGLDAVAVISYHTSKGLEWPVVVLTGLAFARDADMWSPEVTGGQPQERSPLCGRTLRYWPWPFGYNAFNNRVRQGSNLEVDALITPEGLAVNQRDEAESLRLLYVGFTRARDKLVLAHREGKYDWLAKLPDIDTLLSPVLPPGEHSLPDIGTSYVIRHLDDATADNWRQTPPSTEQWLTTAGAAEMPCLIGRYHSPSEASSDGSSACSLEQLSGNAIFPSKMDATQYEALGNSVHAYLSALPSVVCLSSGAKAAVALRCLQGYGVEGLVGADQLVEAGERFRSWANARFPGATWHTEVPISGPRSAGGQWIGVIDLLLLLPTNEGVIVDHKSAAVRRDQCVNKAKTYSGQIQAYNESLRGQGICVRESWIHFPLAGVMAFLAKE
jgi:ATP-dependent helicase/nuclease subunit A